jgi:enterochelin esterase-like enzyme
MTADALILNGDTVPFIIVMPYDRYGDLSSENMFAEAVVEDLIPWIDQTYRTIPERAYRAVGGLSRGAGWAVHLGISNWELFGALGAHSLAVLYADAKYMRTWLDAIPYEAYPRIYLDIGDNDSPSILESAIWFETLLNQKSIPHEWHLFTGFHNEEYWQTHIEGYLRWYAQEW